MYFIQTFLAQMRAKYFLLVLLLFAVPIRVGGQNVVLGIFLVFAIVLFYRRAPAFRLGLSLNKEFFLPTLLVFSYVLWNVFTFLLNPSNHYWQELDKFVFGYLAWIIVPLFLRMICYPISEEAWGRFYRILVFLCVAWAFFVISQAFFPWWTSRPVWYKLGQIRVSGFHSHPLTFAYVLLFFWPFAVNRLISTCCRSPRSWLLFFSIGTMIILSESRMLQISCFLVVLWSFFVHLRGKQRVLALLVALAMGSSGVLLTNTRISKTFLRTFTSGGFDNWGNYINIRLVLWDAHWQMIKERPLTGHGYKTDHAYSSRYYAKIGQSNFHRQYSAHNVFIQILSNGGIIGLLLFLGWIGWQFFYIRRYISSPLWRLVVVQTLTLFLFASLSQNSLHDAEVRYTLVFFVSVLWLIPAVIQKRELRSS